VPASNTGDGFFTECPKLYRVLFIGHSAKRLLPSAREKALGKQLALGKEVVCRVPSRPDTWQTITLGKAVV